MTSKNFASVHCPSCHARHVPSTDRRPQDGVLAATCVQCGHFFKFRAVPPFKTAITLTVNGTSYTVGNDYGPSTALNTWLREKRISVGTKHMCFQGGCGTCLVEAKLYEPISENKLSYAVNSCLLPLYACDGMEIRTVDHIGNLRHGLHPIQKQITDYNGSQCGYCTPGQVMNMFALKERYGDTLTKQQVEDSFDGVICRCTEASRGVKKRETVKQGITAYTFAGFEIKSDYHGSNKYLWDQIENTGYRPILQAFKDLASPSGCRGPVGDIEDINYAKLCKTTGNLCTGSCSSKSPQGTLSTHMVFEDTQWHRPTTEAEINTILDSAKGKRVRFLFGNTSTGVYRDLSPENYDVVVDLVAFQEMYSISFDSDVVLGAGLTLTNLHDIFIRMKEEAAFFGECSNLLMRVANLPVRNRGTWTGNICMKHVHKDFPSDVYVMLQVLKAQIWTGFMGDSVDISDFLDADITGKIIQAFSFTMLDANEHLKFYKVTQRAQNAHCYVTGGFRAKVDNTFGTTLTSPVVIAYAGLGANFNRATKTEDYLNGKDVTEPTVLQTALATLKSELVIDESPLLSSVAYRQNLALSLFYKFVLHLMGDQAGARYQSGATELFFQRPISTGTQSYDTVKVEYPVTEPIKKLEANAQATGEAEYVDDMITYPGQLEGAFVLSTVGNAKLGTIDPTDALAIPGVVKVLTAKDIQGTNNIASGPMDEELLASSDISYCGQAVALVLADSYGTALGAAAAVKVTYTEIQTPIVSLADGIKQKSFFPKPCPDKVVGNPDKALSDSAKTITGSISMGAQYHFHMETQVSMCVPSTDGLDVYTPTQWIDLTQNVISNVTGLAKNSVRVQVKRIGGAYGAKITRNNMVAAACALAANITDRPVKLRLTMGDNMKMVGKRFPYTAQYKVGFTEQGQLNAMDITYYGDCGINPNEQSFVAFDIWADNAYLCPNWKIQCVAVKTNTSLNTACRSPGSLPAIFITESIMEHVASSLGKDQTEIRLLNMYTQGAVNPLADLPLDDCHLKPNIAALQTSTNYQERLQEIKTFNANNAWKKRGISLVPLKFGIDIRGVHYGCQVSVYNTDGSVAIGHGGIEQGQGLNTKVAQVCAYELGIPMEQIKVLPTDSLVGANSTVTGGSIGSENCCKGIIQCCQILNARIDPVKAKLKDKSWKNVINQCFADGIDLSARAWSVQTQTKDFEYYCYGATITEAEFDVLTGEHTILRSDVQFDCGQSTNPAIDVGQVEGAFVMGLGYWLTEQCRYDPKTGALLTDSTWEYKPPSSKDIPVEFNVSLLKKSPNKAGVLGAKAVGEPPMCMSCSALFAIKHAIEAARSEVGQTTFFPLSGPATPEECQMFCLTEPKYFVLKA